MAEEVKKRRGRPKGSGDKTKRKKRELTQAQKDAQFKPGNKANKDGWSMRKEIRAFRKRCHTIVNSEEGMQAMLKMWQICAENGKFKEFMEISRFLAEYAYGKPKEMLETEEQVNVLHDGNLLQQPIIGLVEGSFEEVEESDKDYID